MQNNSVKAWLGQARLLVLALIIGMSLWQSVPALAAPSAKELSESYRFIDQAFNKLQKEALEEKTTLELVNASLDGMVLYVESQKLDASFIKHAPADYSDKQAKEYLRKMLVKTATTYPKLYEKQRLTMEAVKGAMNSIDAYTAYLDPEAYKTLQDTMAGGNFGGIGVVVRKDQDTKQLIIVEPMPDTPAMRAGIRAKDRIIKIGGKDAQDLSVSDASKLMRGEPGTSVTLTIQRGDDSHPFDVTLVREKIHVSTATGEVIEEQGHKIGYVNLSIFGETTNRELEAIMRDFDKQNVEGYVLDVRNNAGGYVTAAIDVCSKFLPPGQRVTSINPRVGKESVRTSRPTGIRRTKPLVVCVNGLSASASEITAGAMKDLKRGTLVGVKTFGKGSVQNVFPVRFPGKESSAFKITIAHYHTPSGHDINKMGITPDVIVELPEKPVEGEKYDAQKKAAINELIKKLGDTKKEDAVQATASASSDTVTVNGLIEERAYIDKQLNGKEYSIEKCHIDRRGDQLTETVTVKTKDGQTHQYKFDISSVLSL